MAKAKTKNDGTTLEITAKDGKTESYQMADVVMRPQVRNGYVAGYFGGKHFSGKQPDISDTVEIMADACQKVRDGDLSDQRDILTSQAMALDALFTSMVNHPAKNMGEYLDATDRYMRLALKAQTQCRTTIEALDRLARGGEQVIKHVHVDNRGGQAVIADTVQTGGEMQKQGNNPMQSERRASPIPSRCGAKTRSGKPCQSPGMANGRCRMHGGPSTGAPRGNRNAWKHGAYSAETKLTSVQLNAISAVVKRLVDV